MSEDPPQKKQRKRYTMTKQREGWTAEEHEKFVEALDKFGRNWRKTEEYLGTNKDQREALLNEFEGMKEKLTPEQQTALGMKLLSKLAFRWPHHLQRTELLDNLLENGGVSAR